MKWCPWIFCSIALAAYAADAVVVEEIAAKVNGDIITTSELERARRQIEAELEQQKLTGPALEEARKERESNIFRDRIDQLLLVQKAKELNINVDSDLSKYLAEIQLRYKIADQDKFHALIHDQTGMPFEDFKAEVKNNMLTQRVLRQEVGGRITISREEVAKYYNEHKDEFVRDERVFLREILISTEGTDEAGIAAAEKKAKDLVARARNGENFGELARDNSAAATASNYGDLGGWKKGQLRKEIEDLVFAAPRNYVTDPIRQENGFLILKVEEHHKAGQASLEEVENEITEKLYMPRFQPKVREYLTKLREQAFLEIKEGYTDSGAAPGKDTHWTDPAELKPETVTKAEVASAPRRKRLLWVIPIPGTSASPKSSSR